MRMFWSYNGDCVDLHETEEAARAECRRALDAYRDASPDGWAEEVGGGSMRFQTFLATAAVFVITWWALPSELGGGRCPS